MLPDFQALLRLDGLIPETHNDYIAITTLHRRYGLIRLSSGPEQTATFNEQPAAGYAKGLLGMTGQLALEFLMLLAPILFMEAIQIQPATCHYGRIRLVLEP